MPTVAAVSSSGATSAWVRLFAATLVALLITWGAPAPAGAQVPLPDPGWAEQEFVRLINELRVSRGLGPLTQDPELVGQARVWSERMRAEGRIFHTSDMSTGVSSSWAKLGENVGVGAEVQGLFDAFVASPSHLENLVDPSYTRVGVGVVLAGDRMYTAHRFMALQPPPPPPPVPTTTSAPVVTVPPTTTPSTTVPASTTSAVPSPTTTLARSNGKLGPLERIAELVA